MEWLFYAPLIVVSVLYAWETLRSSSRPPDWNWFWRPNAWQNYWWSRSHRPGTWRFFAGLGIGIVIGFIATVFVSQEWADAAYNGCCGLGVIGGYIWDITTDTSGKAL
jgi:hypothetical protein